MRVTLCRGGALYPKKRTEAKVVTDDGREFLFEFGDVTERRALALIPIMIRDIQRTKHRSKRRGGGIA
jgi:hypothetical protein